MSKLKRRNVIPGTDLQRQTCRGREIAPVLLGDWIRRASLLERRAEAIRQAELAGYAAVAVADEFGRGHDIYLYQRGEWRSATWPLGKWGPAAGLRFDPPGARDASPHPAPVIQIGIGGLQPS